MPLPLLEYAPSSQNQRVAGYEVPGDEKPRQYSTDTALTASEMDTLILAAYRQIFNEQQILSAHRPLALESQLKSGQISVRDFISGLLLSDSFRRLNYDSNNNYRFVELVVQRVLGRNVYGDREKLAWSIVLATQGLQGFADALLNSDEYLNAFGDNTVPFQRRRILPQRTQGELPFARTPRYGKDYLVKLEALGNDFSADRYVDGVVRMPAPWVLKVGAGITYFGAIFLSLVAIATILSWFGWINL